MDETNNIMYWGNYYIKIDELKGDYAVPNFGYGNYRRLLECMDPPNLKNLLPFQLHVSSFNQIQYTYFKSPLVACTILYPCWWAVIASDQFGKSLSITILIFPSTNYSQLIISKIITISILPLFILFIKYLCIAFSDCLFF